MLDEVSVAVGGRGDRGACGRSATPAHRPSPRPQPSNFLDRDSLAALVAGLDAYGGGVVVISHCKEFTDAGADHMNSKNWTIFLGN